MNRTVTIRATAAFVFLLVSWAAYTQSTQPPQLTLNKVKDDLYSIEGDGGNVAVYITSEGVVLVDNKYDRDHEAIMAKVRTVTAQPVKYVFTTHHHEDHSGGNGKFLSTAQIISTANARANIIGHKQPNASANVAPANIVFNGESSVFLGGREVQARQFGRGHTNGDAIIYFPALKTLHTGDLMSNQTPVIDYGGGGSIVEWTKTLDAAMTLDIETVIPGHGPVTNKADLKAYRDMIERLRNRAAGLIHTGKSQDEVGKVMTAEFGWAQGGIQMQWSLPGLMTELK